MSRYGLVVFASMATVALLVWFVPGAAETVENLVFGLLMAVMY